MLSQNHLLKRAVALYQAGDLQTARLILQGILNQDQTNQPAWIYYARTFPAPRDQAAVLHKILQRHPQLSEVQSAYQQLKNPPQTWENTTSAFISAPPIAASRPARRSAPRELAAQPVQTRHTLQVPFILSLLIIFGLLASSVYFIGLLMNQEGQNKQLQAEKETLQVSHLATLQDLQQVQINLSDQLQRNTALSGQYSSLKNQYKDLTQKHQGLTLAFQNLEQQNKALNDANASITQENKALNDANASVTEENKALNDANATVTREKKALEDQYASLTLSYDDLSSKAIVPPFITVWQRQVTVAFYRSNQSILYWTVPFDLLEQQIQDGGRSRGSSSISKINLLDRSGGKYTVVDFRPFVDPSAFSQLIPELYREAENDEAFLTEAWYMVSQLTHYATDKNGETPRYPLETLLAGGGDCEDTSILFASMVKAAPVYWQVSLGYIDSHDPYHLGPPNHVIVIVNTGSKTYYVETTGGTNMLPYSDNVTGWFLKLE